MSDQVTKCPHCGAKFKKKRSSIEQIGILLLAVSMFGGIVSFLRMAIILSFSFASIKKTLMFTIDLLLSFCYRLSPEVTKMNQGIIKAVQVAGSNVALAKILGVHNSFISQWKNESRPVPLGYLPAIERATGVTKYEIKPEVFGEDPAINKPAKKRKAA